MIDRSKTGSVFFIRDNIAAAEYVQYICYN